MTDPTAIAALVRQLREDDKLLAPARWTAERDGYVSAPNPKHPNSTVFPVRVNTGWPETEAIARTRNSLATIADTLEGLARELERLRSHLDGSETASARAITAFADLKAHAVTLETDLADTRTAMEVAQRAAERRGAERDHWRCQVEQMSSISKRAIDERELLEIERDQLRAEVDRLKATTEFGIESVAVKLATAGAEVVSSITAERDRLRVTIEARDAVIAAGGRTISGYEDSLRRLRVEWFDERDTVRAILGAPTNETLRQAAERVEVNYSERAKEADAMRPLVNAIPRWTKHGPLGDGGPGDCAADCLKCAHDAYRKAKS